MVNYQNGKIYSIRSMRRPDLVYVGSTTQSLSRRFSKHKGMSDQCRSKQIIALGDAYIDLIEEYRCDNRDQLLRREGQIMRSLECVNRYIPGRTYAEYYQDNKDKITEQQKQYRQDNKEHRKQYRQDNKEKIAVQKKQYYQNNKEKISEREAKYRQDHKEKNEAKCECECGVVVSRNALSRHKKSKKHKFWIQIHNFIHS